MTGPERRPMDSLLHDLQERAKELHCLYRVDDVLARTDAAVDDVVRGVLAAMPSGWQHPAACVVRAVLGQRVYEPEAFAPHPWVQSAPVLLQGERMGQLEVYYTEECPAADEGPFLWEERKLLETIADHLAMYLGRRQLRRSAPPSEATPEWWVILEFLRQTDRALLGRLGRRMINHLCWSGVEEAESLLRSAGPGGDPSGAVDENSPLPRAELVAPRRNHGGRVPHRRPASARRRDRRLHPELDPGGEDHLHQGGRRTRRHPAVRAGRRSRAVPPLRSRGERPVSRHPARPARLPGPALSHRPARVRQHREAGSGSRRLPRAGPAHRPPGQESRPDRRQISGTLPRRQDHRACRASTPTASARSGFRAAGTSPPTRSSTSSPTTTSARCTTASTSEPDRIRLEYPHIVQLFKNSFFTPDVLRGLNVVLDDLEGRPIIVRSSSLLEDRLGSAFSGKYKSLFLANTGSKRDRLAALTDAIAEVYASVFSPDPIEYRARRGLPRHARGDGNPGAGGGGPADRPLLPALLLGRRLLEQRVPLVGAHPARGRPAAAGARPRYARGRPAGRRLSGAGRLRANRAARQPDCGRGAALLAEEARRDQSRARRVRDDRGRGLPARARRGAARRTPDAVDRRGRHGPASARPDRLRAARTWW